MTRFARAKGSKASNERLPNEATPWYVMKQQLEDNLMMKNNSPAKTKSAKELLNEKDDPFYYDTTGNVNNDWAEFESPETSNQGKKVHVKSNNDTPASNKKGKRKMQNGNDSNQNLNDSAVSSTKKSKKRKSDQQTQESLVEFVAESKTELQVVQDSNTELTKTKKNKKEKKAISTVEDTAENTNANIESNEDGNHPKKMNKKNKKIVTSAEPVIENKTVESFNETKESKKKKKNISPSTESVIETTNVESNLEADEKPKIKNKKRKEKKILESNPTEIKAPVTENSDTKDQNTEQKVSLKVSKRHKRNQKRIEKNAMNAAAAANGDASSGEAKKSGGFDAAGNDWSSNVNFGKRQKVESKENIDQSRVINGNSNNDFKKPPIHQNGNLNNMKKRKAPKIRDDKEHKRKKPNVDSIKCVINGMEVEIVKFDGFPVKKEDAERLTDLRKQMVMKGIPKSEIDGAMKLERRRAEKSLARIRKQVCFHCRKAGHNLSDCPEFGQEESATGICFKCGSTEHTHFECKVNKKEEFRFASCFICREQGHIAKQCPDNPKGLYPQGGCCKICGDVTHLRKDCPDLTQEKEESTMTLNTITESALESLDDEATKKVPLDSSKKATGKIVKF